jgi:hypothetical protein
LQQIENAMPYAEFMQPERRLVMQGRQTEINAALKVFREGKGYLGPSEFNVGSKVIFWEDL